MGMRGDDPWGGMLSLREAMNRLLEDSFVAGGARGVGALQMTLDVYETRAAVVVRASMPGVRPEDIEVTVTGDTLTMRGELRDHEPAEVVRFHHREHRAGTLARSVTLPVEVQSDKVEATFENGVLTLTLPKAERPRPQAIRINVGGGATTTRARSGASRSPIEGERAEVAPTTDEASAESGRAQPRPADALQTGGAAGPSDETADLPGDASDAGRHRGPRRSDAS